MILFDSFTKVLHFVSSSILLLQTCSHIDLCKIWVFVYALEHVFSGLLVGSVSLMMINGKIC